MSKLYTIQESTLKGIADAIRKKFNFTDDIPTTQFPMYISSGDAKQFWVTHFNTNEPVEGAGSLYTKTSQLVMRGWHDYFAFKPIDGIANGYEIVDRVNWRETGDTMGVSFSGVDFTNLTMTDGIATVKIPTAQTLADGSRSVYTATEYNALTGFNTTITTGAVQLFTSLDTWASNNPNWSYAVLLRQNVTNVNNYSIVDTTYRIKSDGNYTYYPIEIVVDTKGSDYTPIADDFKALLSSSYKTGDIILAANGAAANSAIFKLRAGRIENPPSIDIPTDGFVYMANVGNNYPSLGINQPDYTSPAGTMMWQRINYWEIGQKILLENINLNSQEVPTSTPSAKWYDDNYVCTAYYDTLKDKETITIDGNFNEDSWAVGGWIVGDPACGGVYQTAETPATKLTYKYKLMTDETYLYGGFISSFSPNDDDNNPSIIRIWIRSNPEASLYTHIIDVRYLSTGVEIHLYKNASLTENQAEIVEQIEGAEAVWKISSTSGESRVEFKVGLANFIGTESFEYFISYGNKINDVQYVLFAQPAQYMPYKAWDESAAVTLIPAHEQINSDEMVEILSSIM